MKSKFLLKKTEGSSGRSTRSTPSNIISLSEESSLISMMFMPKGNFSKKEDPGKNEIFSKFILLNIITIHKDETGTLSADLKSDKSNVPIESYRNSLKDKKIVYVKLTFDLRKRQDNKTPIEDFLSTSIEITGSYDKYTLNYSKFFDVESKIISQNTKELKECFNKALCSQKDENKPELSVNVVSAYKELFKLIGFSVYNFKSLIKREAHFQAVLHGLFDYYSDIKSKKRTKKTSPA